MTDFLLELRSEEIPARMQAKACADLEKLFAEQLAAHGVTASAIETHATPRRLALIARGLPQATEATREERRGPRTDAPDKALEGFLRSVGLTKDQLEAREEKKGSFYFAVVETPGRDMAGILAEAIPAIVRAFPWPKSMRWGADSRDMGALRWVRPLQGIVALLGGEVVPCEVGGITSGRATVGHRFMSDGPIEIASADDYEDKLRAARVILRADERQAIILKGAEAAAADAGLSLIPDPALLSENAGLTEWPVPLLGRFDEAFLAVPPEVIQLAMKTHQKYFSVADAPLEQGGTLTNAFICTANIEAPDGGAKIVEGNRKVLAARLSDARFFWEQDLKTGLDAMAAKLADITFHEKLGTIADKVGRVAKLARWLADERIVPGADPDKAEHAARLAKADLTSQMVYEFPELQGVMGGYYAAEAGEDPEIAAAIRDHYKPVGQNDEVPTAPVTVAVSLADKLDTLVSFFANDMEPTGSRDPFALRRAALAVLSLLFENELRVEVSTLPRDTPVSLMAFFVDRLKVQQREAGVRHDLIDAVFAIGDDDDLVRLLARVKALQAFMGTDAGAALLTGYKRAANILKAEAKKGALPPGITAEAGTSTETDGEPSDIPQTGEEDPLALVDDPDFRDVVAEMAHPQAHARPSYGLEPAEAALGEALSEATAATRAAIAEERFEDAMTALSGLRAPIDTFFDEVTVNAEEEEKRAHRLGLLAAIRDAAHEVADFSKIEG